MFGPCPSCVLFTDLQLNTSLEQTFYRSVAFTRHIGILQTPQNSLIIARTTGKTKQLIKQNSKYMCAHWLLSNLHEMHTPLITSQTAINQVCQRSSKGPVDTLEFIKPLNSNPRGCHQINDGVYESRERPDIVIYRHFTLRRYRYVLIWF